MRYILGIDTGGTKCDALLAQEDGQALGWGQSAIATPQGRGPSPWGNGRSPQSAREAVEQAIRGCQLNDVHVAARMKEYAAHALPEGLVPKTAFYRVTEPVAVMAMADVTCGLVSLAGTGAFVHGANRQGKRLHLDGLGPLLGDRGSGFQIGLLAIQAASRSGWHARHQTSLADIIYGACGGHVGDKLGTSLIEYMLGNRDRSEIAALAVIVNREAEAGDRVAREILRQAAAGLADTTRDVVDRLAMHTGDYALIGTGSVALKSRIYWEEYCAQVRAFAANLKPVQAELPQVVGMIVHVLHRMPGVDAAQARTRLFETTRALLAKLPAPV